MNLETISRIQFPGSSVQFLRTATGPTGWCAMAYQDGLPVASRTITEAEVLRYMQTRDHHAI